MKRAMILTVALVAICLVSLWLGAPEPASKIAAPIDTVIDHQPWCARKVEYAHGRGMITIILSNVERGVCTSRNVIRN